MAALPMRGRGTRRERGARVGAPPSAPSPGHGLWGRGDAAKAKGPVACHCHRPRPSREELITATAALMPYGLAPASVCLEVQLGATGSGSMA
jgi:hypothetical protein